MFTAILCIVLCVSCSVSLEMTPPDKSLPSDVLNFKVNLQNTRKLPRFWIESGFCPPAPTNDSFALANFFLSEKTIRSLEYISALPNNGIKVIRIHWLFNLMKLIRFDKRQVPQYNFSNLDTFMDHLMEIQLYPVIEFMGNPSNSVFNQKEISQTVMWKHFVHQVLNRYIVANRRWIKQTVQEIWLILMSFFK